MFVRHGVADQRCFCYVAIRGLRRPGIEWRHSQLEQPVLVLWSTRDDLEDLYGDPLAIWRDWAGDVRGHGIDSGHHVAELAPDDSSRT